MRRGRVPEAIMLPREHFDAVVGHVARGLNQSCFGPELLGVPLECAEDSEQA